MLSAVMVGGCLFVGPAPPEQVNIRPLPPRLPTYTVSGQAIIAAPGPISVTVQPVGPEEVHGYFRSRPPRVNPFQGMQKAITPFLVRIENRTRDQVTFDPGLAVLKDQDNRPATAWDAMDLHQTFGEKPALLQAAQGGVFTGYLVVPPDQSREGLLIFPALPKDAKALLLHFSSLYAGPAPYPLIFEFTVVPEESKK
ncbi:MAG: hypothetical protein ACREJA_04915 [Candidatus Methylomirabilales bacterium]